MNKINCYCSYCGTSWNVEVRSESQLMALKCPKCDWHKLSFKEVKIDKGDIFGYRFDKQPEIKKVEPEPDSTFENFPNYPSTWSFD